MPIGNAWDRAVEPPLCMGRDPQASQEQNKLLQGLLIFFEEQHVAYIEETSGHA